MLGQDEVLPQTFVAPVTALDFTIPNATPGTYLARLRIDGIDSPIIDRSVDPPVFLNQRIVIS